MASLAHLAPASSYDLRFPGKAHLLFEPYSFHSIAGQVLS